MNHGAKLEKLLDNNTFSGAVAGSLPLQARDSFLVKLLFITNSGPSLWFYKPSKKQAWPPTTSMLLPTQKALAWGDPWYPALW